MMLEQLTSICPKPNRNEAMPISHFLDMKDTTLTLLEKNIENVSVR
jgi:hypothetical protein